MPHVWRHIERVLSEPSTPHVVGSDSTVSMRVVRALLEAVEMSGIPQGPVAQSARLDRSSLGDLDRRVDRGAIYQLCEAALDATRNPAFGLHWAEHLPQSAFSPISQLTMQSATLGDALNQLQKFHWLLCDEVNFRLLEQEGLVVVQTIKVTGASPRVQRLVAEMILTGMVRLIRAYRSNAQIDRVSFDYPAPDYVGEYTRIFGRQVRFGQPFCGLAFERSLLSAASPFVDNEFHHNLRVFTERRIGELTQQATYQSRVRALLIQAGSQRNASMQSVARTLGICDRTLRRRLTAEGTSYDAIAGDAWMTIAKAQLLDPQRTIKETAADLGFGDRRAFHRAFRRWTGMTPAQFRKNSYRSPADPSPAPAPLMADESTPRPGSLLGEPAE